MDISSLIPAEIDEEDNRHVVADFVGKYEFFFTCPYCWSRYKSDGTPFKNAKRIVHTHGSNGEMHNRIEARISHCVKPTACSGFKIHITDKTKRPDYALF